MTHPSHSQTIRLPRVADKVMKIDIAKSTILILLVALSATGFSAAKKSYKTMTTEELEEEVRRLEEKVKRHEEEVKRQQLIREINKGCSDPSKLIGGAQDRAQWLADREKARREEWHKRNMEAREHRIRSNINYRSSQKNVDQAPIDFSGLSFNQQPAAPDFTGSTDLETDYNQTVYANRQILQGMESKRERKKFARFAVQQESAIRNEAREKNEEWVNGL